MRIPRFTILFLLIVTAVVASVVAYFVNGYKARLREANRIEHANQQYCSEVLRRCDGIAELRQFIELYNPEQAREFVDDDKVVSVMCLATIDDRYTCLLYTSPSPRDRG